MGALHNNSITWVQGFYSEQPLAVLWCVSSLQLAGVPRLHLEDFCRNFNEDTPFHIKILPLKLHFYREARSGTWWLQHYQKLVAVDIAMCTLDSFLLNLPAGCQIPSFNHCCRKTSIMQISSYKLHSLCSITDFWRLKSSEVSLTSALWKKITLETSTFSSVNVKDFYFHLLNISVWKRLLIPYSFQGQTIDTSNYTDFFLTLTGQNPGNRHNPDCVCPCDCIKNG